MRKSKRCLSVALVVALLGAPGISGGAEQPYKSITGPCNLQFPRDHGAHPGYRTEWWYYTGNLESADGRRFGFQLTFFRSQMSPPGAEEKWPQPASAWRTQQLYLAHAALSDLGSRKFFHAEAISREALGLAGVRREAGETTVFLKDWSAVIHPDKHLLQARSDDFSFSLALRPGKPAVLHGESGYSRKGRKAESASCYYSLTRLQTAGTLEVGGQEVAVEGSAWMDHEFSSAPLEPDLVGWDWFSLQLSDDTELMIYLLRQKDGGYSPASSGTFVAPSGDKTHLSKEMFAVEILDFWTSPHSSAVYPAKWRIRISSLQLQLTIVPNLADQEMRTPQSTRVTYWEGSVAVEGSSHDRQLTGVGYVELTGYEKEFDAPM